LATNPCASALYSSGFTSARLEPIMALGRSPAAITCVYRPLASRLRLPLGLTQNAGLVPLAGTSHKTNVQLPTSCCLSVPCWAMTPLGSRGNPSAEIADRVKMIPRVMIFLLVGMRGRARTHDYRLNFGTYCLS